MAFVEHGEIDAARGILEAQQARPRPGRVGAEAGAFGEEDARLDADEARMHHALLLARLRFGRVLGQEAQVHVGVETGVAGMYVTGPYMMPRFDKSLGADKYTVVPAPEGPKDSTVLAEGGAIYLLAGSENEKGQAAFANYYISPDAQTAGMKGTDAFTVQLPVNKTVHVTDARDDFRYLRRRLFRVDRDPNEFRAGAREFDDLRGGRPRVGCVRIGHRLNDDRLFTADRDATDVDGDGVAACDFTHRINPNI